MEVSDMRLIFLCLLSPWFGPTPAQFIKLGVVTVSEGGDALLPCALASGQNIDRFDWRKDNEEDEKKEVFFYDRGSYYNNGLLGQNDQFKNRVEFFQHELKSGNASIIIKNTRLEDNGTYTCVLFEPHRREVNIRLNVGAAREPLVRQISGDNTWSLLECKVEGVPKPDVEWKNSAGDVLLSKETQLKNRQDGNFVVKVYLNVTKTDNYICVATQRDIFHQISNTVYEHIAGGNLPTKSLVEYTQILFAISISLLGGSILGVLCFKRRQICMCCI